MLRTSLCGQKFDLGSGLKITKGKGGSCSQNISVLNKFISLVYRALEQILSGNNHFINNIYNSKINCLYRYP